VPGISAPSCLLSVFLQISLVVQRNSGTIRAAAAHSEPGAAAPGRAARENHLPKNPGSDRGLCPAPLPCTEAMAKAEGSLGKPWERQAPIAEPGETRLPEPPWQGEQPPFPPDPSLQREDLAQKRCC